MHWWPVVILILGLAWALVFGVWGLAVLAHATRNIRSTDAADAKN